MRVLYVGNFEPAHSTENDVRQAFEHLGWEVDRLQEREFTRAFAAGAFGPVYDRALSADLVLHTMTQGSYPDPERVLDLWRACERAGVPTASIHLDLFYGLASPKDQGPQRSELPREHPMFRVAHVFTADGGHQDEFARDGVNHHWLPPGVKHGEAIDIGPIRWAGDPPDPSDERYPSLPVDVLANLADGQYLVGFAGSDGYHPEWPHRPQLVAWLRATYGDRFIHIGGSATPRVTGLALNRVLASVPVWVGDSCLTAPDVPYWSDRVPETWGRGGFLIHPRVESMCAQYGEVLPGYDWQAGDWATLRTTIDFYVEHADRREEIRQRLAMATRDHETYVSRVAEMLAVIGLPCTPCGCHETTFAEVVDEAPGPLAAVEFESVRILRLEPGDRLVITAPAGLRPAERNDIRERVRAAYPDHDVLVLTGLELSVLREEHSRA